VLPLIAGGHHVAQRGTDRGANPGRPMAMALVAEMERRSGQNNKATPAIPSTAPHRLLGCVYMKNRRIP
jgi:hypothetical protein